MRMDLKFSIFSILCSIFWIVNGTEAQTAECKYGIGSYYYCDLHTTQANFDEKIIRIVGKHEAGYIDDDVKRLSILNYNRIKTFSPIFCQKFPNIEGIQTLDAGIESIDEDSLLNCKNLKYLNLHGNNIRELPEDLLIGNSKLTAIWLNNNQLTTLPEDFFFKQKELEFLYVDVNKINHLPSNIFRPLVKLEWLFLRDNQLEAINPEWFATLQNLRVLGLNSNQISEVPSKVFASLRNLWWLGLEKNRIKILNPNSFDGLKMLQVLDLDHNEISDLPAGVFIQSKNLRGLWLDNNKLIFIHSDSFGVHNQLTTIHLQGNQIIGIDEKVIDNTAVSYLYMENNVCSQSLITDRDDIKQNLWNCFGNYQPRPGQTGKNPCGKVAVVGVGLIIGGTQITRGSYPWIAALTLDDGKYFCGGTLVSDRKVVTAAHCFDESKFRLRCRVLLGVHDLSKNSEVGRVTRKVQKIHKHSDWNPDTEDYDADIAVLVLDMEVSFNQYIQPICIMNPNSAVAEISQGVVVGFGKNEDPKNLHENIAKVIEVPIHKNEDCFLKNYLLAKLSSKRTFCGGIGNGTGVCKGDSGSGLFVTDGGTYYLRGIVSASLINRTYGCDVDTYSIFTDVLKFTD